MDVAELRPHPVLIEWGGRLVKLRPFDLRAIAWAERFFYAENQSGFERMNQIISGGSDPNLILNTIIDIVYHLGSKDFQSQGIENEAEFKIAVNQTGWQKEFMQNAMETADEYRAHLIESNDLKRFVAFQSAIEKAESIDYETRPLDEVLKQFRDAVQNVFKISFPDGKTQPERSGGAIYQQLTKDSKSKQGATNWPEIFVKFSDRFGMSIDEFYSLTVKQVDILMEEIGLLKFDEFKLDASIHGIKTKNLSGPTRRTDRMTFTDQDKADFEKMHEKLCRDGRIN